MTQTRKRIKGIIKQNRDIEKNFPRFIQIIRAFYFRKNNIFHKVGREDKLFKNE